ncbi:MULTISPECIES: XRE family transcriptional regulator [Atopobiaceae]|uniref:XRE family transcriptional regulator n=1 Tax=Thermophilibacter provencensis TaxID=1852386 RepID=A0A921GJ75_9ACTN|nr:MULTISPECIES: XRE family transcriptional regulator [Atopobiaceae]HJF46123.1 XRE family transcriptional regulator [Thermophilibacter provencensis]
MRSAEAIRRILDAQGRSQRSLAIGLDVTPQALDQRLRSKTMKVETLCEMASELGYRLVLEPVEESAEKIEIEG